jgi:hypothetical protein
MHGGMDILERPSERLKKDAEYYIQRADSDPGDRRLWVALALECLRLAAGLSFREDAQARGTVWQIR